ncbi:MAG: hypothetical protein CMD85_00070 [Gammaproteobacteria bacterium]|nr:hypothetical protein [Gammaproteobacteria bacterium]|tara:strand:+ start:143 stop:382 length:240 start_codon:yes stop_codon:yes gene_type:complete
MKNLHQTLSLEALISMEEEEGLDLNEDDLKKVLILTGSFLNSGSELSDIEESIYSLINELVVHYLVNQENRVPRGTTIQ